MTPLSRFQKELLQFFQLFVKEEGRPPRLDEIALRFGIGDESAQCQICSLQKRGFLLPREIDPSFLQILCPWTNSDCAIDVPILGAIPAGIPEDHASEIRTCLPIPLEQLGIPSSADIFALEVRGDSMIGKHILNGDFVVLNKSKQPRHGDVVAALVDNQTTLKTYIEQDGRKFLHAENPAYNDIFPEEELTVQGVMIYLLRKTA